MVRWCGCTYSYNHHSWCELPLALSKFTKCCGQTERVTWKRNLNQNCTYIALSGFVSLKVLWLEGVLTLVCTSNVIVALKLLQWHLFVCKLHAFVFYLFHFVWQSTVHSTVIFATAPRIYFEHARPSTYFAYLLTNRGNTEMSKTACQAHI